MGISIQNLGSANAYSSINQLQSAQRSTAGVDRDGDNDGSGAGGVNGSRNGGFLSAIMQALSQIGAATNGTSTGANLNSASGSTNTTTTGTPSTDPQSAMTAFMQDLFAALQSQGGTQPNSTDATSSTTQGIMVTQGQGHHHHHGGGAGAIEGKLQSLIAQLSSANTDQSATNTGTGSNSTGTGSSSAPPTTNLTATLQTDFKNLLDSLGISNSSATLSSFLTSVSQNIQGGNPGLNVKTAV